MGSLKSVRTRCAQRWSAYVDVCMHRAAGAWPCGRSARECAQAHFQRASPSAWRHACPQNAANDSALSCTVTLNIDKDMQAPVYVYYELNGLYQNHRRSVRAGWGRGPACVPLSPPPLTPTHADHRGFATEPQCSAWFMRACVRACVRAFWACCKETPEP